MEKDKPKVEPESAPVITNMASVLESWLSPFAKAERREQRRVARARRAKGWTKPYCSGDKECARRRRNIAKHGSPG